ncbi:hypothetical protein [Pleurocapsa sp. PCC 7319]|uniref:oxidoreductase n=1 Tax=Pleurocapsa sp. PCC 7319 TaxID=118161 RepID=UPI00130E7DEC|nr:hypothetical protein [Pleurocapsa sp. PCC 7319]
MNSPVRLGAYTLSNRIVIAPNPRLQADDHLPQPEAIAYYADRASCGLIVTEPTLVSAVDKLPNYPGIFTRQQLHSWRAVTEAVKKQNGKIFLQLCYQETKQQETNLDQINLIALFRHAAQNALAAEFDGVEINFDCFGCFPNQNISKIEINSHPEEFENKIQLCLTIAEEVASIWDENRVGVGITSNLECLTDQKSILTRDFYYFLDALKFYDLAYLHLEDSIVSELCEIEIFSSWLNLLYSLYSGVLIINCQNISKIARERIIKHGVELVSFKDLSAIFI